MCVCVCVCIYVNIYIYICIVAPCGIPESRRIPAETRALRRPAGLRSARRGACEQKRSNPIYLLYLRIARQKLS